MSQSQKTNKPLSFVENCRGVHDDDVAFARVSLKSKVEKVLGVYRFSESLLVDSISVLSSVSHAHPSIGSSSSLLLFESNRTNEGRMSAKKQRTFKLRAKDFEVGRAVADGWFRNARTRVRGVGKIEIEICSRFSTSLRRDLSSTATSTSTRGNDDDATIGVVVTHRRSMCGSVSGCLFVCLTKLTE